MVKPATWGIFLILASPADPRILALLIACGFLLYSSFLERAVIILRCDGTDDVISAEAIGFWLRKVLAFFDSSQPAWAGLLWLHLVKDMLPKCEQWLIPAGAAWLGLGEQAKCRFSLTRVWVGFLSLQREQSVTMERVILWLQHEWLWNPVIYLWLHYAVFVL